MSLQESLDFPELKASIFRISNTDGCIGTAFAIGPNLFVTNHHVIHRIERPPQPLNSQPSVKGKSNQPREILEVSPEPPYFLSNENGDRLAYDTLVFDAEDQDLALFKTKGKVSSYLEIAEDILSPSTKDRIILGYPHGIFTQINQIGKIKTYTEYNFDFVYTFPIDVQSKPSCASGSPVFFNGRKKVIAVVAAGGTLIAHSNQISVMVINLEYLQKTINDYKSLN